MNQDFTVKKKQYLSEKKFVERDYSHEKKIPAQAVSEKKISCKLKIPHPPPITFLMVRSLGLIIPSGQSVSGHVVQAKMFASDTSPKLIDPEGRGKRRTWTRQGLRSSLQFAVHG